MTLLGTLLLIPTTVVTVVVRLPCGGRTATIPAVPSAARRGEARSRDAFAARTRYGAVGMSPARRSPGTDERHH